ncbi:MAG: phosphoglycolate phosphatase [Polaromonas sp.]
MKGFLQDIDAAIIDLDGTLVDTLGDFVAALERMRADLSERGFVTSPLVADQVIEMVGKGSENLVKSALNHLNSLYAKANIACGAINSEANSTFALARYLAHYEVISGQHAALYPGVMDGLRACQAAGLPLACVTNKPVAFARPLLQHLGLGEFFSQVFGGDSFARKKPDPMPLLKTCEALGTLPARTLMVGDSSNDAEAARAAGCPVVLVTYGYNHGQPIRAVDADGWVDSLADLFELAALTTPR